MKFNKPTRANRVENYAGGEAFQESPELELVSILLSSFVKGQYYRSEDETIDKVGTLIDAISDKTFPAKAAIYARTKFGMRSITHVLAAELAKRIKGEPWTKNFYDKVVYRPDDIIEILSFYLNKYSKPIPNSLKKGLALSFGKFDAYQLAKYRGEGKAISLIDAVNLVRPKPNDKNAEALKKLVAGKLKSTETWEANLTEAGKRAETDEQKDKFKAQAWTKLIKERKLGYFALLRNLRNISEQAPELINDAAAMLTDEKLIKKSLVLPFRFMTATKQLQEDGVNSNVIYKAINDALEISFANVPKFDGKTLVVVDHSGSMDSTEHGNLTNFEIGALFGVALAKSNDADFMYFGDIAKYAGINPVDSTPTLVEKLDKLNDGSGFYMWNTEPGRATGTEVGHGTNFHAIFEEANKAYDRIVIFSDMQGWVNYDAPTSSFAEYKRRTGSNPKIFSIDLAGYGTLQFPERDVFILAGFSDKIFDLMKLLESDRQAMINEIKKIEI